jgi:hypothetical protein
MSDSINEALSSGQVTIESGEVIVHQLKSLLDSEAWKMYRNIVERQQVSRFDRVILNPLPNMDAVLEQEYMKGEIQGLRMALMLPQAILDDTTEQVRHLREQREAGEAEGDQQ